MSKFYQIGETVISEHGARMTDIAFCGEVYKAHHTDSYIYDALHIAERWRPEQRTHARVCWLRTWLRENEQHGHDLATNIRTMSGAKMFIDKIIRAKYPDDEYWGEQRKFQLEQNAQYFK